MSTWQERHAAAWNAPHIGVERAIVTLLKAWHNYGNEVRLETGYSMGEDGYLGPEYEEIAHALVRMLSGPCGNRLDLGYLDAYVRETLKEHGLPTDW